MLQNFSNPWLASSVLSALMLSCFMPAAAQAVPTVRVGNEIKRTGGTVVSLENGDIACHLLLKDEQGVAFKEMGDFEICSQKPSLVGKRVMLSYSLSKVMSDECQGDPNCKKFRSVALVTMAKPVEEKSESRPATANNAASNSSGSHRCGQSAVKQAERLLRFHALPDQPRQVDVAGNARALGTIKRPAGGAMFDVLEVDGAIYKSRYRLRMIYGQIPGECVLVGQEILEITNL